MKAFAAFLVFFVMSQLPAFGALNAYMQIRGQKQGQINGKSSDGKISVVQFTSGAIAKDEMEAGRLKSGHRTWKPIVVRTTDEAVMAHLRTAMVEKDRLQINLFVTMPAASGIEEKKYSVKFVGAEISSLKGVKVDGKEQVEISFTFQKIEWTSAKNGTTATDDWSR